MHGKVNPWPPVILVRTGQDHQFRMEEAARAKHPNPLITVIASTLRSGGCVVQGTHLGPEEAVVYLVAPPRSVPVVDIEKGRQNIFLEELRGGS